jgi:hypothetical protein
MHRGNRQCFGGELNALTADARQEDLTFQGIFYPTVEDPERLDPMRQQAVAFCRSPGWDWHTGSIRMVGFSI